MKTHLIKFWKEQVPINFKERVDRIPNTCCPINLRVTDFDKVKDEFSKIFGIVGTNKLSSVDAITLDKNNNLCLLEMKGYNWKNSKNKVDVIMQKILDSIPKFVDSVYLLICVLGYYDIPQKWYHIVVHTKKIKITPYLVIDCSYQDLVNLQRAAAPQLNQKLSSRITHPIQLINCQELERFFG
jgi:hypothetical protein